MVRMLGLIYDVTLTLGFSVLCSRCCNNFRRQLDNTHFCLADGFMTIFPCPFACRLVLSWLDRSKKTMDWWKFKEQLWIHLEGHLSLDKSDNLHYQHKSLFSDCSWDVLLIPGDAKGLRATIIIIRKMFRTCGSSISRSLSIPVVQIILGEADMGYRFLKTQRS